MKNKFIVVFTVVSVLLGSISVPTGTSFARAENVSYYTQNPQYNFTVGTQEIHRQVRTDADLVLLLQEVAAYLRQLQAQLRIGSVRVVGVEVVTQPANNITNTSSRLNGEIVDFNAADEATVWFEYGRSNSALINQTTLQQLDNADDSSTFSRNLAGLRRDTQYFFRAVARGNGGANSYGSLLSFTTNNSTEDEDEEKDNDEDEEPEVTTRSAKSVADNSAIIRGNVAMNEFENGRVFFIYGEDQDAVVDVETNYERYEDIDEEGDDLQKVLVDRELDGGASYEEKILSLDDTTRYYFNLCVEYEESSRNTLILCGQTLNFRTN